MSSLKTAHVGTGPGISALVIIEINCQIPIKIAILIIGGVGLILDKAFNALQNAFSWE